MNRSNLRFFDQTQPQTLQIGVILLYINAFFSLLNIGAGFPLGFLSFIVAVGGAASGIGIANSKRAAWMGGVAVAILLVLIALGFFVRVVTDPLRSFGGFGLVLWLVGIGFDIALLVALVHPQSREYQKIWFE